MYEAKVFFFIISKKWAFFNPKSFFYFSVAEPHAVCVFVSVKNWFFLFPFLFRLQSMPLYDGLSWLRNHVLPVLRFWCSRAVFAWWLHEKWDGKVRKGRREINPTVLNSILRFEVDNLICCWLWTQFKNHNESDCECIEGH
jgi:hypothetical protein